MNDVFLQLGSNIGDRKRFLSTALSFIKSEIGSIVSVSKIYESSPWRVEGQNKYLNQILKIKSKLEPEELLKYILDIESKMGRKRIEKWGERVIDIDIIFFSNYIIETKDLCIPHKHMHKRNFVLVPLNDIASNFNHPKYNISVSDLLHNCQDIKTIEEYE
jgi:2-amino-4-hydroxy-6-hydroxymethyldihydropteridine diphosphokinase